MAIRKGSSITSFYAIDSNGCWLWLGTIGKHGYGGYSVNGKKQRAHKVMWERTNGAVPDGLVLNHKCKIKHCVNPDHLEPVTQKYNARDGVTNILTLEKANEIRNLYTGERGDYKRLAILFKVSLKTISDIILKKTWT